jgi:hypothetical protein
VAYQLVAVGIFSGHIPPGIETTAALHLSTLPVSFGLLAFVFAGHAASDGFRVLGSGFGVNSFEFRVCG